MDEQNGFSLFEVVIAFAIAAVVLVGVVRVYAGAGSAVARATDLIAAAHIADERMAVIIAHPRPRESLVGQSLDERFVWQAHLDLLDPARADDPASLVRITLRVYRRGRVEPLVQISSLRQQ